MRVFGQFARAALRRPSSIARAAACASLWAFASLQQPVIGADYQPDVIVLTSRVFDIPFQLDATSKAQRVRLYVSADHGQSWTTVAEQSIPVKQFHFEATSDGDYWFAHSTDLDVVTDPPSQLKPERKIRVDTSQNDTDGPAIELDASSDLDGKLSGNLKVADPNRITALRVLYATDVVRQWKTVANESIDADGNFSIQPDEDWRQMSVHITAIDSIGNASVQSKLFRRPRIAAVERPRLAATENPFFTPAEITSDPPPLSRSLAADNRLRVQTAAGPSDPPSFLLGPGNYPGATPSPAAEPAVPETPPAKANGGQNYALQSPGAGPLQSPLPGGLRDIGAIPKIESRGLSTFGSAFGQSAPPPASSSTAVLSRPDGFKLPGGNLPAGNLPAGNGPMTLPATGLTAKVTPQGIEVLPAPVAEIDRTGQADASSEPLPPPKPAAAPAAATPAIESIPTPQNDPAATGGRETGTLPNNAGNLPRSVEEALRPMQPTPLSPKASGGMAPAIESIPTPSPSGTTSSNADDERQMRVERAEQLSREQQQRYDRAQMARSVPFRWSNSNRFSLEYELEAVGASGTESVELYGSIDAGKTWKRWGADPDRSSPFDIETKGEGVFGFRIVVLGNNGLSSPRPLPGDNPDIAVIVDQTNPKIKITSARYGEGDRTGSLVISYECSDENLMNRPVAIAFSDSIDGPWTTIAAGLRNEGLYVWPADPKLPPAIYLRVDATDQAGNTGSYLLDQPIATGGLAPRARILGFQSR